ncbi:calcium-binding protein CML14 [Spatholobus suberectus]|nr:calcium-binding protein CML14 [Spatholobus suberectus]
MTKHMMPEPFDHQLHYTFKVLNKDSIGFVFIFKLRHILANISEKLKLSKFNEWIIEVNVDFNKILYKDFTARMMLLACHGNNGQCEKIISALEFLKVRVLWRNHILCWKWFYTRRCNRVLIGFNKVVAGRIETDKDSMGC